MRPFRAPDSWTTLRWGGVMLLLELARGQVLQVAAKRPRFRGHMILDEKAVESAQSLTTVANGAGPIFGS